MLTSCFVVIIVIELFKSLGKPSLNLIKHCPPKKVRALLVHATKKSSVEFVDFRDSDVITRTLHLRRPPFSVSLRHNWGEDCGEEGRGAGGLGRMGEE